MMIHGDGLAIMLDLTKASVKNKTMRFIKQRFEALPQVQSRVNSIMVKQDYGLRNEGGDAASRNDIGRIVDLCKNLHRRPIQCAVPDSVAQLVEDTAKQCDPDHTPQAGTRPRRITRKRPRPDKHGRAYSSDEDGDGPSMMRSPKATANSASRRTTVAHRSPVTTPNRPQPMQSERSPKTSVDLKTNVDASHQQVMVQKGRQQTGDHANSTHPVAHRSPTVTPQKPQHHSVATRSPATAETPTQQLQSTSSRSPKVLPAVHTAAHTAMRRSPIKKVKRCLQYTGAQQQQRSILPAVKALSSQHKVTSILNAYPEDSPFRINPSDPNVLNALVHEAEEYQLEGVPDSTRSKEKGHVKKYWIPFCALVGMSPDRPALTDITPQQAKWEDYMKGICIPYIYANMRGKKNPSPDPNSVLNAMRNINRHIMRGNDDDAQLKKPLRVIKGILTKYVKTYGPILPDQALPFSKPLLTALLQLPSGTKLGSKTLQRDQREHKVVFTMVEVGAETGIRLDEATAEKWDLSKMSRGSLTWWIDGDLCPNPTNEQLMNLTTADGGCLTPATSKCDRWGNKHGSKTMFLPYRPDHIWNAARALRDQELKYPVQAHLRTHEPLFATAPGIAVKAAHVRTVLYYMMRDPSVVAAMSTGQIPSNFSFHSLRKTYATGLARSGASRERIQSMVRWLSAEAVDLYDKLGFDDHIKYVDAAYLHSAQVVTPAVLRRVNQTKIDDNDIYATWARQCHVDLTAMPPLDWS